MFLFQSRCICTIEKRKRIFVDQVGAEQNILPNGGHINYDTFEEIVPYLGKITDEGGINEINNS